MHRAAAQLRWLRANDAAQLAAGGVLLWLRADPVLEAYDELKLQQ